MEKATLKATTEPYYIAGFNNMNQQNMISDTFPLFFFNSKIFLTNLLKGH